MGLFVSYLGKLNNDHDSRDRVDSHNGMPRDIATLKGCVWGDAPIPGFRRIL